jgi:hypothetical protein
MGPSGITRDKQRSEEIHVWRRTIEEVGFERVSIVYVLVHCKQNRRKVRLLLIKVIYISDMFEDVVRFVGRSPRISFGLKMCSWGLKALFLCNVVSAILPLVRPKSRPLTNIPLTPAQRDLIGLDKSGIIH